MQFIKLLCRLLRKILEQKNKNVISSENQGGISGISGINYNDNELDKVQRMIKEQEIRKKKWDGTIEY